MVKYSLRNDMPSLICVLAILSSIQAAEMLVRSQLGASSIELFASEKNNFSFNLENGGAFSLKDNKNNKILTAEGSTLSWNSKVSSRYFEAKNDLIFGHEIGESAKTVQSWKLVFFEPFEGGESHNWVGEGTLKQCGPMSDFSLHHNCLSTEKCLKKLIKGIPKHSQIKIQLSFHFLD